MLVCDSVLIGQVADLGFSQHPLFAFQHDKVVGFQNFHEHFSKPVFDYKWPQDHDCILTGSQFWETSLTEREVGTEVGVIREFDAERVGENQVGHSHLGNRKQVLPLSIRESAPFIHKAGV